MGIAGTLTLALLGSTMNRANVSRINRQSDFKKAAVDFRKAFTDILLYLQDDPSIEDIEEYEIKSVSQILNENYNSTLSYARITFQNYLGCINRFRLDRAWDNYCHPDGIPKDKYEKRDFVFNGYYHIEETSGEESAKKIAFERINNILKFAKLK